MERIITIGREYGSGGREIGRRLAEKLQFAFFDYQIVTELAKRTAFAEEYILSIQEKRPYPVLPVPTVRMWAPPNPMLDQHLEVFLKESEVIRDMADKAPCVIVGRSADYILRERKDVMNVFIHADLAFRADRIVRLYGESEKSPEQRLRDKDKKRAVNYKHFTGQEWGMSQNYHLSLDSGAIGIDECVRILAEVSGMKKK